MAEALSGHNHPSGVRLVVAGFDNEGSSQESLRALKAAIDQGFRTVVQGNGSGVSSALPVAQGRFPAYQVAGSRSNQSGAAGVLAREFRQATGEDMVVYAAYDGTVMLLQAMTAAESVAPAD